MRLKKYGANTEYRMLHYWVEKQLGKPNFCVRCKDSKKKRYCWANISKKYKKDISDWERLCCKCHTSSDLKKKICINGHSLISPKSVYNRINGHRECKICHRKRQKRYRLKKKV